MSAPVLPDSAARQLGRIEKKQARAEAGTPESYAILGPRSDLATGVGVRVRIGLLSDGSYGIERYTSSGTRQVPTWV